MRVDRDSALEALEIFLLQAVFLHLVVKCPGRQSCMLGGLADPAAGIDARRPAVRC